MARRRSQTTCRYVRATLAVATADGHVPDTRRNEFGPRYCVSAGPGRSLAGGRYWVRTSDLFGVNEARYHCANRPCSSSVARRTEVETGFEPV